tara:strand:- start:4839 stop:5489 length:651 start_codon:yes stop_codon:yes gene_type:complete
MTIVTSNIQLLSKSSDIGKAMVDEFLVQFNKKSNQINTNLSTQMAVIVGSTLNASPTVRSLLGGTLKDDFGLRPGEASAAITNIIAFLSKNVTAQALGIRNGMQINLNFLPGGFDDILSVPGGSYQSTNGEVNWLEWLLTRGTQVVIADYALFDGAKGKTRSGGSKVMIPQVNKPAFRVDPEHAGTIADNFISRALDPAKDEIGKLIINEMQRSIK